MSFRSTLADIEHSLWTIKQICEDFSPSPRGLDAALLFLSDDISNLPIPLRPEATVFVFSMRSRHYHYYREGESAYRHAILQDIDAFSGWLAQFQQSF